MNVQVSIRSAEPSAVQPALAIADCDIHPYLKSFKDLHPFLETRWQRHLDTYGLLPRQGFATGPAYPKGQPDASRRMLVKELHAQRQALSHAADPGPALAEAVRVLKGDPSPGSLRPSGNKANGLRSVKLSRPMLVDLRPTVARNPS